MGCIQRCLFLREREKDTTAFKSMMRYIFKYEDEESAPNLSDKVEIIADRGYWGRDMLRYLPSSIDDDDYVLGNSSSDSDSSDDDDGRASHGSIEEAEDFILCFFCLLNSSEYEELRKEEAASVVPDYTDEQLVHCLGLIHGAPKGKREDERHEILLRWTQCSQCS